MKGMKKLLSVVVVFAMVAGLISGIGSVKTKAEITTTRYEAEDADISNARPVNTAVGTAASGGKAVPIRPTQCVVFTVNVAVSGSYTIPVRYATGNTLNFTVIPMDIIVNGTSQAHYDFANTGSTGNANGYKTFATQEIELELAEGENTIEIKNIAQGDANTASIFANIDYIEITEGTEDVNPDDYPAAIGRHEAENAELGSAVTLQNDPWYAQCSNGAVIGIAAAWNGNTISEGKYVAYTVNAQEDGEYILKVAYATSGSVELLAQVNSSDWTLFDESDAETKILPDPGSWRDCLLATQTITLNKGINKIYVSGSICDWNANWQTIYGGTWGNIPAVNIDYIELEKVSLPVGPEVTVDGKKVKVTDGKVILGDAKYGYYCDGRMYKPETEVAVEDNMEFSSVKDLTVSLETGAGIRYLGNPGIKFQAQILSDNDKAVADQNIIKQGTLITAEDIYQANKEDLTLTSKYTYVNVKNKGWYNDKIGAYCGSLCNIVSSNYIREFTAVAYVTIEYTDKTSITVYSNKGSVRSISQVAAAVKADGYRNIEEKYHSVIDSFIR